MTIETSLRNRARWSRCLAVLWLSVATLILAGAYISLPMIVCTVLQNISSNNNFKIELTSAYSYPVIVIVILITGLIITLTASYFFARSAYVETEIAARFSGLADALCIAGDDIDKFEKTAAILVPRSKLLLSGGPISTKDLKPLADIIKIFRP